MFDVIWTNPDLPNLTPQNSRVTSSATPRYNCIAWAANCDTRNWWPGEGGFWPRGVPRKLTLSAFSAVFETLGYEECQDDSFEPGYEKIAIFATREKDRCVPQHAARQLPNGKWTSKIGPFYDIEHEEVHDVNGPEYGAPVQFMRRSIS